MSTPTEIILSPAERYLHLSSEYSRDPTLNTSNCIFRLAAPVISPNEKYVMSIGVHNASVPHTWYNIFGRNWTIYFGYLGITTLTGAIPDQNYTAVSLANALQTSINAALVAAGGSATFTVTYNSENNFYTFSNSIVAGTNPWYFVYVADSIYYELGMRDLYYRRSSAAVSSLNVGGTAYTFRPLAACDLSAFHSVYMNLVGYPSNSQASYANLAQTSVLARIPVKQPFTAIEQYEPDNITYVPMPGASLSDLQITLTGDDGLPLDLHGADWTATLHIKFAALRESEVSNTYLTPSNLMQTQVFGGRRAI
jgi:hypothetical protein